jgi:hypothetical protein
MSIACSPACQGADTIDCLHPTDCTSGICCESVVVNGGQAPNCVVQSLASRCANDCKTVLTASATCQGTDTLHICAQASDCQNDASNPNCCTVGTQLVCVSNALAMNLQCM